MDKYTDMCGALSALVAGIRYETANLANTSALLVQYMDRLNWAGFYKLTDGQLVLGPFQGKPACIMIPLGKGVCGTAAASGRTVLVEDVHNFPGHIACDSASNSEIVIPLTVNGTLWGVLDLDSPVTGRFSDEDRRGLEAFAEILEDALARCV